MLLLGAQLDRMSGGAGSGPQRVRASAVELTPSKCEGPFLLGEPAEEHSAARRKVAELFKTNGSAGAFGMRPDASGRAGCIGTE